MSTILHDNITVNAAGHLAFAGMDTAALAEEYGTPLYLLDEQRIRRNCGVYREAMRSAFGSDAMPLFAGKALCLGALYPILREEGMGADVVSGGELYTALRAGFPAERLYFHGDAKTDREIEYGIRSGVGCFVVDNAEELEAVGRFAVGAGRVQPVLLRLTPGIDPHTFKAVSTGRLDCQFGVPIETGQAMELAKAALKTDGVRLMGWHCHLGSQIFEWEPYRDAIRVYLDFSEQVRRETGFETEELNLGGGIGVRYTEEQEIPDIAAFIAALGAELKRRCAELGMKPPRVRMEPGRSIVADAGMTIYTVQSVKSIPGGSSFVIVDGGMSDNPRYALYQSPYTVLHADRPEDRADFRCTLAGRCCESGALLQENILLPKPVRGEHIAMAVTGAYQYSMASNYNRLGRAPVVLLDRGTARLAARREEYEDLCKLDIL